MSKKPAARRKRSAAAKATPARAEQILVTGDIVKDHHLYEGERLDHRDETAKGLSVVREIGGAALTQRLLEKIIEESRDNAPREFSAHLAVHADGTEIPACFHGYALWSPMPRQTNEAKGGRVWRVTKPLGYGPMTCCCQDTGVAGQDAKDLSDVKNWKPKLARELPSSPKLVVLDDAGACFRTDAWKHMWCLPGSAATPWVLLKLSGHVGVGALWQNIRARPSLRSRLAILVSARMLRESEVRLSRGLSWERTVEHLLAELFGSGANPRIKPLTQCRHLVVNFEQDGAIWIDVKERTATLVYDAAHAEGEWAARLEGQSFAYQTCLAAALAWTLARDWRNPDIVSAMERGLTAMRLLRRDGHGPTESDEGTFLPGRGFPCAALAKEILSTPSPEFSRCDVPSAMVRDGRQNRPWSILTDAQNPRKSTLPLFGLARQIVLRGEVAIRCVPHLRIGALLTVAREEMEAYRALRRLFEAYKAPARPGKKPLSVGVFGSPGAGKSFGVEQLAIAMFAPPGAKKYDGWMEFNLSQFSGADDLIGAFHQVRDRVLQGLIPVVFWDEFDSQNYKWLQYLLAPMQDGRFQERETTHTLGRCVFIFAGGTARTFDSLGPREDDQAAMQAFKLAKGPDFKSRLDGYLDVLGPNQRQMPHKIATSNRGHAPAKYEWRDDPSDISYPVRRALMIRFLLDLKQDDRPDMDGGLLTALLQIPAYRHGARSLEKTLEPLKTPKGQRPQPFRRSRLPAPQQLCLHVNNAEFHKLVREHREIIPRKFTGILAVAIHEVWRSSLVRTGGVNPNDVPFDKLPPDSKHSNRAAADRIPGVLALAGLELARGRATDKEETAVRAHIEHHLELLADAEHEGWMADRIANGWRYAEKRDNETKHHNCLKEFRKLARDDQNKDREQVRHYPDFAKKAGMKIVFIAQPRA